MSDEELTTACVDYCSEIENLQRQLAASKSIQAGLQYAVNNLQKALNVSVDYTDELNAKIKMAKGHMNLYRLFSCEGGDSYDPECAEKNLDKVMEVLK